MSAVDVGPLLNDYREISANYGPPGVALSDHLPMTVTALAEMGAHPERIAAWARAYRESCQLRVAGESERAGRAAWRARIRHDGVRATLAYAASTLGDGIGAAAFHAAIRAAYALERNDDDELAAALDSWQREYLALPVPTAIRRVAASEALGVLGQSTIVEAWPGLIFRAMELAAADPAFERIAQAVPRASDLDEITVAAGAAFAVSRNFTALHVMTGTHALRVIRAHVDDIDPILPAFWRAFAAAWIVAGSACAPDADVRAELRAAAPPDWAPLLTEAIAHTDEHAIKAVYTAWRLDRALREPLFRTAAARYLEKLRIAPAK